MLHQSLNGIRVIDLTRLYPGPLCTLMLADLGADVIKVEAPGGEPARYYPPYQFGTGAGFLQLNRGKRSITLDLKKEKGAGVLKRLLQNADILVESFRPGVMKGLGLDYETMSKNTLSLIYCSVTGYGQSGPYARQPGHDLNYISVAGILGLCGEEKRGYLIPPVQIADIMGAYQAVAAILAALVQRARKGYGQYLDISLLDGAFFTLIGIGSMHFAGLPVTRNALPLSGRLACYGIYRTKDDKYLAIALLEPKFWRAFCRLLQLEPYSTSQFQEDQKELIQAVSERIAAHTQQEWLELVGSADLCVSPVNDFPQVLTDPQLVFRKTLIEVPYTGSSLPQFRTPFVLETSAKSAAPSCGQHNREILREAGYSDLEIASLQREGVLA